MDIYKCPKSKTKSRIYFFFVTRKNHRKNNDKYKMIYGKTTEILIYSIKYRFIVAEYRMLSLILKTTNPSFLCHWIVVIKSRVLLLAAQLEQIQRHLAPC